MRRNGRPGRSAARRCFGASRGAPLLQIAATQATLTRNRTARNRHQAARARHDRRDWQMDRRKRTRQLIELGGLVAKAGIVEITGDDRTLIYGALLWMADRLEGEHGALSRGAFKVDRKRTKPVSRQTQQTT